MRTTAANNKPLPAYVQAIRSHGRTYLYFRRDGRRTRLPDDPDSPAFYHRYAEILAGAQRPASLPAPGSVRDLARRYKASPQWAALSAGTQREYGRMIDRLAPIAEVDARLVKRRHVRELRDGMAATPRAANVFVQVAQRVFDVLVADGELAINPASGIEPIATGESYAIWSAEDCARFEAADVPAWARTAYMLGRYTGQRRGDVLAMMHAHVDAGGLTVAHQEKTGARVVIPLHSRLGAHLAALPRTALFLVPSPTGKKWGKRNFTRAWRTVLDGAGLPHLHFHGLRHTAASALAEAGCSEEEIKSITGHESSSSVAVYVRQARKTRIAANAMAKLERAGTNGESGKIRKVLPLGLRKGERR